MAQYALRMDYVPVDADPLSEWLSSVASRFLVVYETHAGENPHVHAIFYSDKKEQALRATFKRKFPTKVGNKAYSLKPCDDDIDAYLRYICKGADKDTFAEVVVRQGLEYDNDKLEAAHAAYWVNNASLQSNKRKRTNLKDSGTVVEQVEKRCKDKGVRASDRKGIAEIYIRMYRDARKPINTFAARSVVNTVQLLLDDEDRYVDELAAAIAAC